MVEHICNKNKNKIKTEEKIKTLVRKLRNKMKKNDIIATRADKGNTMVLMKKEDYINKAEKFIKEGPYKEVKYDYTNKYQLYRLYLTNSD